MNAKTCTRFLVAYDGRWQTACYGGNVQRCGDECGFIEPYTFRQARRALAELTEPGGAIFEIVRYEPKKVEV